MSMVEIGMNGIDDFCKLRIWEVGQIATNAEVGCWQGISGGFGLCCPSRPWKKLKGNLVFHNGTCLLLNWTNGHVKFGELLLLVPLAG